jgi:transcriptional/translational regulatory protein YebC/TACO1
MTRAAFRAFEKAHDAFRVNRNNRTAAQFLRAAMDAEAEDIITDDQFAELLCDLIDYLDPEKEERS